MNPVYLHHVATAVPENFYYQDFVLDFLLKLMGENEKTKRILTKIYENTGIEKRHSVIEDYGKDPAEYTFFPKNPTLKPEPSTMARNDLFIREANRLSLQAASSLLAGMKGFDPGKITHLITVSCTGFSAPGFDLNIIKKLKLSSSIHRFHIGFMGCYAAFPALKMAKSICASDTEARVLIVNAELCTVHFQQSEEMDMIVGNAIFADGVSAVLVSADENDSIGPKLNLRNFESRFIEESEKDMAWKIGETGFEMKLSAYVPRLIQKNIESILTGLLSRIGKTREDINIWAFHPGGRAILDKIRISLNLEPDDLAHSYETLKQYGNMSSATVFFVLKRILEDKTKQGPVFSAAFGPGLTVESALMEKV